MDLYMVQYKNNFFVVQDNREVYPCEDYNFALWVIDELEDMEQAYLGLEI